MVVRIFPNTINENLIVRGGNDIDAPDPCIGLPFLKVSRQAIREKKDEDPPERRWIFI
jgi:hypothetical protein